MSTKIKSSIYTAFIACLLLVQLVVFLPRTVSAEKAAERIYDPLSERMTTNIASPKFRIVICDGPNLPEKVPPNYVPCDFNGIMKQIQHILELLFVAGVIVAIGSLCYAGYLLITAGGNPGRVTEASDLLKRVVTGFAMMLIAWFVVYQIFAWLTGESVYTQLLGK